MPASNKSIDLVKNKSNLVDELTRWALSFGRLLIIVVEIVAFSAFILRFSLDRKLIDLNDKIKQEQAIVVATKPREDVYRNLQQRLATVRLVNIKGNRNLMIMNDVIAFTPEEITYNSINIENGQIKLDTNVQSVSSLSTFLNSLKKYKEVTSITVNSIQNKSQSSSVNVVINVKLRGQK